MPSYYLTPILFPNATPTTGIYTLSLHDALPISSRARPAQSGRKALRALRAHKVRRAPRRSEEHTSELQSHSELVCRLLLEKKKAPSSGRVTVRAQPNRAVH